MKKFPSTVAIAGLALILAGCGRGETATNTATKTDARADVGMNSIMNDTGNPFAQSDSSGRASTSTTATP